MTSYIDHTELYVHCIWATENRQPFITASIEADLYNVLATICESLQCSVIAIGGCGDHIHVLVHISEALSAARLIEQLKQRTLPLINTQSSERYPLQWQSGYSAFNVSSQSLDYVKNYVLQQKARHAHGQLIDELEYIDPTNVALPKPISQELRSASVGSG